MPPSSQSSRHPHQVIPPSNLTLYSSKWLIREILKRTDVTNGDLCLFHYPMTTCNQIPFITIEDMQQAFNELTLFHNNGSSNENDDDNDDEEGIHPRESSSNGRMIPPEYIDRAQAEARGRITRIQFCWYQFQQFPSLVNTYVNIQHVDIRQNGKSR
jgi:hypothetical protein